LSLWLPRFLVFVANNGVKKYRSSFLLSVVYNKAEKFSDFCFVITFFLF